ncbi:MAG: M15 family metallopeptidase, partial [Clostridia bacterium]|nr:M15 family metallopeptidase [Clostridia bacterium]
VNKENKLPDDWEAKLDTVTVRNSIDEEVEVEKKAYGAYLKLKAALEAEDVHVDLDSARRSVAEQQRIWDSFMEKYGEVYTKRTVATPGYSEHHTGLALDLYLIIDGEDVIENEDMILYPEIWAKIHAKLSEYGFILRYLEGKEAITGYGYEPWHIRYIDSAEIAKEIAEKGITFEEYLDKLPKGDVAPPAETETAEETGIPAEKIYADIWEQEAIVEAIDRIGSDYKCVGTEKGTAPDGLEAWIVSLTRIDGSDPAVWKCFVSGKFCYLEDGAPDPLTGSGGVPTVSGND